MILIYTCWLRGLLRTCILALQLVKVSIPAQSRDCLGNWHDREYGKNIDPSSFLTSVPSRPGQAMKADRQIYAGAHKMVDCFCQYKTLKPTAGLGETHA
ncbi:MULTISPECIES: hypothetical protein [unclassified Microcoleus]|uniref:hypothetical protein n=1 Tax=unclassified Microcoleus TaxID=2642155 RepID=UPI0025DEF119|nr:MULTISPECIES: hypothetical protein [unclassified Microcoleus]